MKKIFIIAGLALLNLKSFSQGTDSKKEESKIHAISLSAGLNSKIFYQLSGGYETTLKDNYLLGARLNYAKEISIFNEANSFDRSLDLVAGVHFNNKYVRLVMSSGLTVGSVNHEFYSSSSFNEMETSVNSTYYVGLPLDLKFQLASNSFGLGFKIFGNINDVNSYGGAGLVIDLGILK